MPIVFKSGSLNLLEISGPVQACNGIALPLPLPLHMVNNEAVSILATIELNVKIISDYVMNCKVCE